jgi:hypothetical protein
VKSPFPGRDPFIEACGLWSDFHGHLVEKIYDTVSSALPAGYLARTGERSYVVLVEAEGKAEHSFLPDVTLPGPAGRQSATATPGSTEGSVLKAESVEMRAFVEAEVSRSEKHWPLGR